MGMGAVALLFAEPIPPEEFLRVALSLGAERIPDPRPHDSTLERGEAFVLLNTFPVDDLQIDVRWLSAYTEILGTQPRSKLVILVSRVPGSEWLAAEVILAVEERWNNFILDDFAEYVITLEEFHQRLAERKKDFFWPGYDASPLAWRKERAKSLDLVFSSDGGPREFELLLRSLGAVMKPDDDTDAHLSRGIAQLWAYLRLPGEAPVPRSPQQMAILREALGDPPYNSAVLDVFDNYESELLAVEVVEAAAARWGVAVVGFDGQVMAVEDLRMRVASGASNLFSP